MKPQSNHYNEFLIDIKERIRHSQLHAFKAVNHALIDLYWSIGEALSEKQQTQGWGKSVVETLASDIQAAFPGVKGFSMSNLWRMKAFYEAYHTSEKLAPLVREIGWSHNLLILEKCKDESERLFYLKMTRKYGWTKNILIHQIEGATYHLFLNNQTNFEQVIPQKYKDQAKLSVKDSYVFDFLELVDEHHERDLELALVKNVRSFLMEMGGDFSFIGHQYKLHLEGEDYFIDLLLYHRRLKSLVAIELKVTAFKPEYAGKMQFYLSLLDDTVKLPDENSSIGIIICKSKKRTVVEYALKVATKPMGVADYSLSNTLPKPLEGILPSPEEIADRLDKLLE